MAYGLSRQLEYLSKAAIIRPRTETVSYDADLDIDRDITPSSDFERWYNDPLITEIQDSYALPVTENVSGLQINQAETAANILFGYSPLEMATTLNAYIHGQIDRKASNDIINSQIEKLEDEKGVSLAALCAAAKTRYGITERDIKVGDSTTSVQFINVNGLAPVLRQQEALKQETPKVAPSLQSQDTNSVSEIKDLGRTLHRFLQKKYGNSTAFDEKKIEADLVKEFQQQGVTLPKLKDSAKSEITDLFDHVNTISKASRYANIRQDGKTLSEVNSFYCIDGIVESIKANYVAAHEAIPTASSRGLDINSQATQSASPTQENDVLDHVQAIIAEVKAIKQQQEANSTQLKNDEAPSKDELKTQSDILEKTQTRVPSQTDLAAPLLNKVQTKVEKLEPGQHKDALYLHTQIFFRNELAEAKRTSPEAYDSAAKEIFEQIVEHNTSSKNTHNNLDTINEHIRSRFTPHKHDPKLSSEQLSDKELLQAIKTQMELIYQSAFKPYDYPESLELVKSAYKSINNDDFLRSFTSSKSLLTEMKVSKEDLKEIISQIDKAQKFDLRIVSDLVTFNNSLTQALNHKALEKAFAHNPVATWKGILQQPDHPISDAFLHTYTLEIRSAAYINVNSDSNLTAAGYRLPSQHDGLNIVAKPSTRDNCFVVVSELQQLLEEATKPKIFKGVKTWNQEVEGRTNKTLDGLRKSLNEWLNKKEGLNTKEKSYAKQAKAINKNIEIHNQQIEAIQLGQKALQLLSNREELEHYIGEKATEHAYGYIKSKSK